MPHADAALFPPEIDKHEAYELVRQQLENLFEGQQSWISNLANAASLLWAFFHTRTEPLNRVNWAGFYVRSDLYPHGEKDGDLVGETKLLLAPFAGLPACQSIALPDKESKRLPGVCASAFLSGETQIVPDVEKRPGHIACDSRTRSEIVVPLRSSTGDLVGVLDIDCEQENGFDNIDNAGLEKIAQLIGSSCDW